MEVVGGTQPLRARGEGGGVGVQCTRWVCFRVRFCAMETASLLSGTLYILFLVLRALGLYHVKKNSLPQLTQLRIQSSGQQRSDLKTQAVVLRKDPRVSSGKHFRKPGFVTTGTVSHTKPVRACVCGHGRTVMLSEKVCKTHVLTRKKMPHRGNFSRTALQALAGRQALHWQWT